MPSTVEADLHEACPFPKKNEGSERVSELIDEGHADTYEVGHLFHVSPKDTQ